jgi:aryl sulfotransferase
VKTIWLASYPKSGSTWFRMLVANLSAVGDRAVNINELWSDSPIASARGPFDRLTLIDSGLLTPDEIDCLRPRFHAEMACDPDIDADRKLPCVRFVKVHDAYLPAPSGEPLLAGARGATAAIVMVRDPRDIACSLAHHLGVGLDDAIGFMNDSRSGFCLQNHRQYEQLRQRLSDWSGHVASWLAQRDVPVHLFRYEDLMSDAAGALTRALAFAGYPATEEAVRRAVGLAQFAQLHQQEQENGFREARPRRIFFRRGEAGAWREELSIAQVARIETTHAAMMGRFGYELATGVGPLDVRMRETA